MEKANELISVKHPSMVKGSRAVLVAIISLVLATVAAVGLDLHTWREKGTDDIRAFQRALGGLGMGSIAAPVWQFINYDARILSVDDSLTWPVPGGYSYGPDRTGTVSYFQEIPENQWIRRGP
jgi:hypothetical protein